MGGMHKPHAGKSIRDREKVRTQQDIEERTQTTKELVKPTPDGGIVMQMTNILKSSCSKIVLLLINYSHHATSTSILFMIMRNSRTIAIVQL